MADSPKVGDTYIIADEIKLSPDAVAAATLSVRERLMLLDAAFKPLTELLEKQYTSAGERKILIELGHTRYIAYAIAELSRTTKVLLRVLEQGPTALPPGPTLSVQNQVHDAVWEAWVKWLQYYTAHFRANPGISMADQQAFFEIFEPDMRALVEKLVTCSHLKAQQEA